MFFLINYIHKRYAYSTFVVSSFLLTLFAFKYLWQKLCVLASLCARETVHLLQQGTPHFISQGLWPPKRPVDPETWLTAEFGDWCRNVHCTRYICDTSNLMQRINDTSASMSKNVKDWSTKKVVVCRTSLWKSAKHTTRDSATPLHPQHPSKFGRTPLYTKKYEHPLNTPLARKIRWITGKSLEYATVLLSRISV